MAKSNPAQLAVFLTVAVAALAAAACSGGEEQAAVSDPGTDISPGLSAAVYASPT